MVRNIPNKYTQEMLLELFEQNHNRRFDFFYLPIDYNVACPSIRITATWGTPSSTSSTPNLLSISTNNFTTVSGTDSTPSKCAKFAMQGFKEQLSWNTTSSTQMCSSSVNGVFVLFLITSLLWCKDREPNCKNNNDMIEFSMYQSQPHLSSHFFDL